MEIPGRDTMPGKRGHVKVPLWNSKDYEPSLELCMVAEYGQTFGKKLEAE